jgi:hypothetical protein
MRRLLLAAAVVLLLWPATAAAQFGLRPGSEGFDAAVSRSDASAATAAASHPYELDLSAAFNLAPGSGSDPAGPHTDGDVRDIHLDLPPGLVLNTLAVAECSTAQFRTPRNSPFQEGKSGESCPGSSQIGVVTVRSSFAGGSTRSFGLFNLAPPPGYAALIGFNAYGTPIAFAERIREGGGSFTLGFDALDLPQRFDLLGFDLRLWGTPWLVGHDSQRGDCLNEADLESGFGSAAVLEPEPQTNPPTPYQPGTCSVGNPRNLPPVALLTLPASCGQPLVFSIAVDSWQGAGSDTRSTAGGPPLSGCEQVPFATFAEVLPSSQRAASATGLGFDLRVGNQNGLLDSTTPTGHLIEAIRAPGQTGKAVVALPGGMTVNPSVGAGLGVCTAIEYAAESAAGAPGSGCPGQSKIGDFSVESPILADPLPGAIYLAQPDDPARPGRENPFDALLAVYLVAKSPESGLLVRVPGKVDLDPASGRMTATFFDLPQIPYSHLGVQFRSGQRSPLANPVACGGYVSDVDLFPSLEPDHPNRYASHFNLESGPGGGPCPPAATPFAPGAVAGTLNRNAGSYSPYYLHLTRADADQEITNYSAKLPPGLLGRLAGIPFCPEAAIAAAKVNSGFAETASPSCPAASRIGRTYSGFGLGPVLAYAPGGLYLAGPYQGAPFSIVAIDAATVGPFDLGTIIVRSTIRVDPRSAQVSVDSAGSDPIPHIVKGIPLHLRDVRVYIDRPNFTVNPTNCEPLEAVSSLSGSGASFASPADDSSASVISPFQVSNCSALNFAPRFTLSLTGATKHGRYPALKAIVRPGPGDANIAKATVTLPPSLFLAQEHIKTICTRSQFAAQRCPSGSLYGHARAITPLLDQPLEGPVYLRSSAGGLPDLVADLSGAGVRIEVGGRIDHVANSLRATFEGLPDAPVTKFTMALNGGRNGLIVNSEDLCASHAKAKARMIAQNNRAKMLRPRLGVRCKRTKKGGKKK